MNVTIKKLTQEIVYGDERQGFEMEAKSGDKRASYELFTGEPEDMIFGRQLEGPGSIKTMIQMAYEAGKAGEELVIDEQEVEEL